MWERTYKQWKGKRVEFVGIGLLEGKEKSRTFVQRHKLTFPNGWDGDSRIAKAYGFTYQPYWAAVTRDGILVFAKFGPSGEKDLVSAIKALVVR